MKSNEPLGNERKRVQEFRPVSRAATAVRRHTPEPLGCEAQALIAVPNAVGIAVQLVWRAGERWGLDERCVNDAARWMERLVAGAIESVGGGDGARDELPSLLEISKTIYPLIEARVVLYGPHVVTEVCVPIIQPPDRSFLFALPHPRGVYPCRTRTGQVWAHRVWCGVATGRNGVKAALQTTAKGA
jgi:hypothetical protein